MSEEPLLSQEETDALLEAMQRGDDEVPVEGLDLTSPERRIRTALPVADGAGDQVAALLRRLMLRHAGAPATADASPAEINPYSVVIGGVRPGSAVARLRIGESFGFVTIGPLLVSFLLERQLGAPLRIEDDADDLAARDALTDVDKRVLKPILREFAEGLSQAWCGDEGVIQLQALETSVHDLPQLSEYEPVLRLAARVEPKVAPGDEVQIVFASSAVTIAFGREEPDEMPAPSRSERARLRSRVDATDVEVAAILGHCTSRVREVLSLAAGDVLRLESIPGDPCTLIANGVAVLEGKPVVLHGNLAIEVVQTLSRGASA